MLKIQEIRELIKLIDQSSIDEFSFENEGSKIKLKKNNGSEGTVVSPQNVVSKQETARVVETPVQAEVSKATSVIEPATTNLENSNLHKIVSPMVGTFYGSPNPDSDPYVKIGDKVNSSSVVCIVEAMKLFNEIEAEVSGEIVEILVESGQLVEYGQPLFLVKQS